MPTFISIAKTAMFASYVPRNPFFYIRTSMDDSIPTYYVVINIVARNILFIYSRGSIKNLFFWLGRFFNVVDVI